MQAQPPDFIAALEQMSTLKDYLLYLHESEVAQLRDEGDRLKEHVFTLRSLVKKDGDDDEASEQPTTVSAQGEASHAAGPAWACEPGALAVRKVLTEPAMLQTPLVLPGPSSTGPSSQRLQGSGNRRPSESSCRPSEGSEVQESKESCRRSMSPRSEDPVGTPDMGKQQVSRPTSQGAGPDFFAVVPPDQGPDVAQTSSRRRRGASRTHTATGPPPESAAQRKGSLGSASNDSAELFATGSRSVASRPSSKDLDGERFHLREVWREASSVLLTSTKNWRGASGPQHPFGIRQLSFLATNSGGKRQKEGLCNLGPGLLHPASRGRLLWELCTTLLVIYDIAVVPMQPFGWPPEPFTNATDWVSRVFWTVDIGASFFTGVYIDLELELRFWEVAKHYAKGWMAFDAVIAISEWIPVFIMPSGGGPDGTGTLLDHFRLLRFVRTFRLLKLEMVFERFGSVFNSTVAWRMNNLVRIFLYFAVGVHVITCGWFWVGSRSRGGWVARVIEEEAGVDYQYLTCVRWTLAQLHGVSEVEPSNTSESMYAIVAFLLGLGSLCLLIGSANAGMLKLEEMRSSTVKQRLLLRSYLRKNNISRELSLAVKTCIDVHMKLCNKESKAEQAKEVLAVLPQNLQMDIEEEVRMPIVIAYGFFGDIHDWNPRIVRQLCHECCSEKSVRPVEVVFAAGDACTSIRKRAGQAVLWVTAWEHCGEFRAAAGGGLLVLEAAKFITMLSLHHASACAYASRYGRKFVQQLNEMAESCWSDVVDSIHIDKEDILAEEERATRIDDLADEAATERRLNKCRTMSTVTHQHYIFISHHKAGGGTEATLMQEALERIIDNDPENPGYHMIAPVFLDSEDLTDLSDLKGHVRNTMNLVLLLTEEVLKRPWVLIEIATAHQTGVHIVPVEIYKRDDKTPFKYPDETFYRKLCSGELLTEADNKLIRDEGISVHDLEKALRHVFKKIALPFSPHKSGSVREAELSDLLRRCTDTIQRQVSGLGCGAAELPGVPSSTAGPTASRGLGGALDLQFSRLVSPASAASEDSRQQTLAALSWSTGQQSLACGKRTLGGVGENPASSTPNLAGDGSPNMLS
ncbi:unnamed protein product [Prorocentrum cordatum]|uniref:Ion transport domain-containing protein n=1 Tax=Prorocentrum cordatum TaxID=2364126 RepID=A0ABN9VAS2_9DINO|nr:unnamed protein product [Polarella glacialis]